MQALIINLANNPDTTFFERMIEKKHKDVDVMCGLKELNLCFPAAQNESLGKNPIKMVKHVI